MEDVKIISPEALLEAYSQGIFPMADSREDEHVEWFTASQRGVIPIDGFHASKNLLQLIRQKKFHVKVDTQFRAVVEACAQRESTWINDLIINSYDILNQMGHAHSVEVYDAKNELVGGLYGVHVKAAFFGESMFKTKSEADKVALYYCHQILQNNKFLLWDTQFYTDHLGRFGCVEIDAADYEKLLQQALKKETEFLL